MAQSSTDSNLRGIPAFWPNHAIEPPTQCINGIDQFHLAIIAKENLDIDNLKEPLELETTISILEGSRDSENDPQRKAGRSYTEKQCKFSKTQKTKES